MSLILSTWARRSADEVGPIEDQCSDRFAAAAAQAFARRLTELSAPSATSVSFAATGAASASKYAASACPTSTVESKTVMATTAREAMSCECRLSDDDTQHRRFGSSGAKKTG